MEPRKIVRAAGIAAVAWVGVVAVGLVRGSSGPAPDPTELLFRLTLGPLVLLMAGNGLAWLVDRAKRRLPEASAPRPLPSSRWSGWPVFHR